MSKLLKKYIHHLHVLKDCVSCQKRIDFVKNSKTDFIKCLCEACDNLLKGNIPINKKQKKGLHRHRNTIRFLASKKNESLVKKKRKLIQQGGTFLPILLPPLLAVAAELIPAIFSQ